jgi:MFS family permease
MQVSPQGPLPGAWRMVGLAFIAQNFSIGLGIASFGVLVLAIEQQYQTNRTLASLGASLVLLAFGLFAPLTARLIERFSIRSTMMLGVFLASAGYAALAVAPNIFWFLAAYLLLVGPGVLFSSNFTGSILINNWFPGAKGRAVGVMMIPLGVMLVPLACTPLLEVVGLQKLYFIMAASNLILIPFLYFIKDRPDAADVSHQNQTQNSNSDPLMPRSFSSGQLMRRADFWLLVAGIGLLNGSGMVKISHLVALTAERGVTLQDATMLLAVSGGAGAIGSMLFGWLADRIGGVGALILNAFVQAGTWAIFFMNPSMPLLITDAILMGIAGAGVYAATIVTFSELYGPTNLPKVMGVSGVFVVIPNFMSPAVAGILRDVSGSYGLVLIAVITSCLVSASCLAAVYVQRKSRQITSPEAAALA